MAYYVHEFGLGVPQFQILNLLGRGASLPSKEIANLLAMNKALVSRSLRELSDLGYVTMTGDTQDARVRNCSLTDKGLKMIEEARGVRHERQDKFLAVLTRKEQLFLVDVLDRLYESSEALRREEAIFLAKNDEIEDADLMRTKEVTVRSPMRVRSY
jgi:DNA-binding MarR family transcriptional regulator